ncbi:MAG: metallophosphoesterase family protein [Candidatus Gorgyraea atricola]|nr:metallophosphoesterase family protein [Candidatus Gorgyraea atricola]
MRIGVISDTHVPVAADRLPDDLLAALKGCDLILHAGDLIDISILEPLKQIAKVEAVSGNMDHTKTLFSLGDKKILKVAGKKICLMHGYGHPEKLKDIMKEEFLAKKPDIIVFGHSHQPANEYIDGVLFFNPGSPTETVCAPYRSYGIIEIDNGKIEANIHRL